MTIQNDHAKLISRMKFQNNRRQKTLENLEKDYWNNPDYDSHLVRRCHELRKIPLDNFTTEDLRIMIGQEISLNYLIPLALEALTINLFAEGDFFEGDLLKNVLSIKTVFWNKNKNYWAILNNLIQDRRSEIDAHKFDTINFDKSVHRH
jgi:contact-dependent growth inhibition (CDI) system CdiI-like immunity protein